MHWHEFYELELILSGSGACNIDGEDHIMRRGSLFFMSPSSFHFVHFDEDTHLFNVMFTANACDLSWLSRIFLYQPHVDLKLSEEDVCFVSKLGQELIASLGCREDIRDMYSSLILNHIIAKVSFLLGNLTYSTLEPSFQYAILYIQNHFSRPISLEEVSRIANYSPSYFSSLFRSCMGMTFKQYVTGLRLAFAEKLLCHTELSVTQIAEKCGIHDLPHFEVLFKKKNGMPPKQYRLQKREDP